MAVFGDSTMLRKPVARMPSLSERRVTGSRTAPEPYVPPGRYGPSWDDSDPLAVPRLLGARDGRLWGRDPRKAMEAEGVAVVGVTPARMASLRSPGAPRTLAFFADEDWPERETVYYDASMPCEEVAVSLAHEYCHLHHRCWDERMAEAYAMAFVATDEKY